MNVLVIEDERLAAERLEKMLSDISYEIKVMAKLESVIDSINWLNENEKPDLIFMDIQLDDDTEISLFITNFTLSPKLFNPIFDDGSSCVFG